LQEEEKCESIKENNANAEKKCRSPRARLGDLHAGEVISLFLPAKLFPSANPFWLSNLPLNQTPVFSAAISNATAAKAHARTETLTRSEAPAATTTIAALGNVYPGIGKSRTSRYQNRPKDFSS